MDQAERDKNRRYFEKMCEDAGYPPGVRPGTSMMNTPFKGGAFLTLPTSEDEYREDAHYVALPDEKKEDL